MTELGRLEPVELRGTWADEAGDFTPWLAQEENLKVLSETIKIDLELETQEKPVGPFRADILCRNTDDGSWVLIENQLERTDHNHLGQLLTYASGLQAVTIIWIAAHFTEEHRASLDWLNEITDENFRFFGLEVELWRIGQSPPAPRFNIISKPNDWSASVISAAKRLKEGAVSETQSLQLDFWGKFNEFIAREGHQISQRKPAPQYWSSYGIGRTGFVINAFCAARDGWIGVCLIMSDQNAKAYFHLLKKHQKEIENEFGEPLDWRELPDYKESRIHLTNNSLDPKNLDTWNEQHIWLANNIIKFDKVFRPRIRNLNADEWVNDTEAAGM